MAETTPVGGANAPVWTPEVGNTPSARKAQRGGVVPPAGGDTGDTLTTLTVPTIPSPKVGGLSLESLVQAIGMEERSIATKSGLESLEIKAQEREEVNAKKMEEIQENLNNMKSKGTLDGFLKAFKIIGLVVGAIASVATVALGAVTGNPLLIAAGVIMGAMAINSIVSEASDGKASIAAGVGALAKACGASDEAAQWIGFGVEMGITLIACGLSLGAGAAASGAKAVETAAKAGDVANKTMKVVGMTAKVTTIAGGLTTAAQGATQGVSAYYDYRVTRSLADQKELAAILERLQQAMAVEQDFLEAIMQRGNDLMEAVSDIVDGNVDAQTAILTGSTPSMA